MGNRSGKVQFVFVLLNEFSDLSLTTAIETLRIANGLFDSRPFDWTLASESGSSVINSQNQLVQCENLSPEYSEKPIIVVCGGTNIKVTSTQPIIGWLLQTAVSSIVGKSEEKGVESLFSRGGTNLTKDSFQGMEDFEVVSYMIVSAP